MRTVAYYRVSTAEQGRSGLGLEAQKKAVNDYVWRTGAILVAEFTEVESGARNVDRILTGTLLPEMSGEFLSRMAMSEAVSRVHVSISDGGGFTYQIS